MNPLRTAKHAGGNGKVGVTADLVRQAVERLHELPCLFPVVREAILATEDPDCSNARMEEILSQDPGLTARVLRLANSAYFGVCRDVSSLSLAVALIGYQRLQMMLRHILVAEIFELLEVSRAEARPLWRTSVAAGAAAKRIAEAAWAGEPEEMLAAGLLHNAGELALLHEFRDAYLAAAERAQHGNAAEVEREYFGVDSGQVGRWLLEGWRLPELFGTACAYWADPLHPAVPETLRGQIIVVHAAVMLARSWRRDEGAGLAWKRVHPHALRHLQLEAEAWEKIYRELGEEAGRIEGLLREL